MCCVKDCGQVWRPNRKCLPIAQQSPFDVLPPLAMPSDDRIDGARLEELERGGGLAGRLDSLFAEDPILYRPQFTCEYTEEGELCTSCPVERNFPSTAREWGSDSKRA